MNPERAKSIFKAADELMEQKARDMVDRIYQELHFSSFDKAKHIVSISLLHSIEWVKSVRAYYKDTKDIVDTIERMIGVVRNLKPLDYGERKGPTTWDDMRKNAGLKDNI